MKRHILILLVAAATCLGSFHKVEAQTPVYIDYAHSDSVYAGNNGFGFYKQFWKINKRYKSDATDTSDNFTCKWAAVRFDSIYDDYLQISYPFATTSLSINSIRLDINHQKNSASNDTLTISVLQRTGSASGISSTDNGITWTNPVLWDTMIVTNSSLTPGFLPGEVHHRFFPCNLTLPVGTKFFIKVDFTGDTINEFYLVDHYRYDCGQTVEGASQSIFPDNSWRYINLFLPPATDMNGVGNLIYQSPPVPAGCNLYYFQNWGIAINADATVLPLTANAGNNDTICSGDAVQLTAFGSGGTLPYQYLWSNAANSPTITVAPVVTTTYYVTVSDALGATAVDSVTVTVNPSPSSITFNITNPSCFGVDDGIVCAIVSGGTPNYTFLWSNGSLIQCNSNIPAGGYSITVTDANTCSISSVVTVTQPSPIVVTLSSSSDGIYPDTVCISSVSGGVPAYTYSYGGNFNQLPNNCFELLSGVFNVTVTDANNCTATTSSNCIGFHIDSILTTDASCSGSIDGDASIFASGGMLPYSYHVVSFPFPQQSYYFSGLSAGNYNVVVTDSFGCSIDSSFTIFENSLIQVTYTVNDVSCFGFADGSIDLAVTGGAQPYTYLWNHGATSHVLTGLAAGTYNVTITDANSCTANQTVIVNQPTAIQSSVTTLDATCGQCNGQATATVSGGVAPYAYEYLQLPVVPRCNATFCDSLCGGSQYVFVVTDLNGCLDSTFFTIGLQTTLQLDSMDITNPTCFFGNNGAICAIVSGGQSPYAYEWSNGANTACIDSLPDGIYEVTVTDAGGCSTLGTATINGQSTLQVDSMVTTNASCNGGNDGAICAIVSGGQQPYVYNWSNQQTTQCIDSLLAGFYTVTVTDANFCTVTGTTTVTDSGTLYFGAIAEVSPLCYGGNDGWIYAGTNGGQPPYNYLWSTGATADSIGGLSAGDYSVTVTDANQCVLSDTFTLINVTPLTAIFDNTSDGAVPDTVLCVVNNGTPPFTIDWQTGDTNVGDSVAYVYFSDGIYMPTVTDSNGCIFTDTIVIGAGCAASCVWPGDADGNGIADNNDLLPIGLAYGTTGNIRLQQDIDWYPHVSQDWADTLSTGVNYKHSDCNGNGVINANDTLAIIQNFGQIHLKNNQRKPWRANETALYVDLTPDTTYAGDTMYANLTLGDINIPAANVYALAFTVNYNALVVDSSKTTVTFGNSWFGTATDKISIAKDLYANGELKCAITRIDHTTRSGFGQIGQVSFIITTDNINGKDLIDYYTMDVWISDLVMIDSAGTIIPANEGADSTQVEFEPTSVRNQALSIGTLTIQPNPANNEVHLSVSNNLIGAEIKLFDIEGRIIIAKTISNSKEKLNTSAFANGMYFVQVKNEKGVLTQRLAIAR